jgi:regulator of sigma E protease
MALAFMNLLPIPGLDGGHVVFLLIEMVQRKPVSEKVLEKAQIVGFVILICLMVFAFGNDILKSFGK